mgnify:FL=1
MIKFKLTSQQRAEHKAQIVQLLESTGRKGIDNVLKCLEDNGFYSVHPRHHHQYEGGLAVHALGVCKNALHRKDSLPRESVIIAALLHDVCDIHGFHHLTPGHGLRSVQILTELGLELTEGEKCAIRNHMRLKDHDKPSRRISPEWDEVLNDADNRKLQELIYHWDKQDAKHHNPFPEMVDVDGGPYHVEFSDDFCEFYHHNVRLDPYKISKSLLTWGFWRFVMGDDPEQAPATDYSPDSLPKSNRDHLFGDMEPDLQEKFLSRLKDMTGLNFAFPTFAQRQLARQKGLLKDTHHKAEILLHGDFAIIAGSSDSGSAICQQCGIPWERIGHRLVINA